MDDEELPDLASLAKGHLQELPLKRNRAASLTNTDSAIGSNANIIHSTIPEGGTDKTNQQPPYFQASQQKRPRRSSLNTSSSSSSSEHHHRKQEEHIIISSDCSDLIPQLPSSLVSRSPPSEAGSYSLSPRLSKPSGPSLFKAPSVDSDEKDDHIHDDEKVDENAGGLEERYIGADLAQWIDENVAIEDYLNSKH